MSKFLFALAIGLLLAPTAGAQPFYIELDFDGILGNGPDVVSAQPGDTLVVDVWCLGASNAIIAINIYLCTNPDKLSLVQFQNTTGWNATAPIDQGNGCWKMSAVDFSMANIAPPFLYGRASYRIVSDNMCGWIDIDPTLSDWCVLDFYVGPFENNIHAGVLVNTTEDCFTTGTQDSNWGEIKTLFR